MSEYERFRWKLVIAYVCGGLTIPSFFIGFCILCLEHRIILGFGIAAGVTSTLFCIAASNRTAVKERLAKPITRQIIASLDAPFRKPVCDAWRSKNFSFDGAAFIVDYPLRHLRDPLIHPIRFRVMNEHIELFAINLR